MALKTKVEAQEAHQNIHITREFDLPVDLLFKAHTQAELFEQWMGTKVIKLEVKNHGAYRFETTNAEGTVVFAANGCFHEVCKNEKITRTFQMENTSFPVQLEFLSFQNLSETKSKLSITMVFPSVAARDQLLQMPFAKGLNNAHNKLEQLYTKLK